MKVKQLIKELNKMPQNLEVYFAAHDNTEWETAGTTGIIDHCIKEELRGRYNLDAILDNNDLDWFNSNPDEWVMIHA